MSQKKIFESITRKDLERADPQLYAKQFEKGLNKKFVQQLSLSKNEPKWLLEIRLRALEHFQKLPLPSWGPDLSKLDFKNIRYFASASEQKNAKSWDEVDPKIKQTFERLRIPEAERAVLAGVGAQYESENVYHNLKNEWTQKGVIFEDFDVAVRKYPDLVKKYFTKCVPITDHKFAALHCCFFRRNIFIRTRRSENFSTPAGVFSNECDKPGPV